MAWTTTRRTVTDDGRRVAVPKPVEPILEGDPRASFDYMRAHRDDFRLHCMKIATKGHGLQPLVVNFTQRQVIETRDRLAAQGVPPRLIVLKSRQVGVSTISEGLLFEDVVFNAYRSSLVLAHTKPAAKNLLRMTRRFLLNLPAYVRPEERLHNVNEIELLNESRMQVEAVGEVRSYTAQAVHFSEFAFYENPTDTLIAVMQSVPSTPDSLAIIESTANGVGNKFHEMWVNAIGQNEDKDLSPWERGWTPIFIPWFEHEEYVMRPWFTPGETTEEERKLAKIHGLNMRQIAWRRYCIRVNCDGDVERFKVEYPSTWQEAFALSGRPVFDREGLDALREEVPPLKREGSVWVKTKPCEISWDQSSKRAAFDYVDGGRLRIFKHPEPRHTYIIGADPSEGDPKSDPSPIEVLDQMTLEFVAEFWGRVPPDILADMSAWLGWYYNTGEIIAEANNQGIFYHGRLQQIEYPNIYFRTVNEETVSGKVADKPGYFETNKAKHLLVDTFRKAVRERRLKIYSPGLVSEMETTIYDRKENNTKTKILPQPGHFIDRVIAAGLTLLAHRGDITSPLQPLPELELIAAAVEVALIRTRDPEGANQRALDLTNMTAADLDRFLEGIHQDRMRREAMGVGFER